MDKRAKEFRLKEIRAEQEDERMVVEGYAIVFDEPTDIGYIEIISRGALDECDMTDVCMKYNHEDTVLVMARTRNGSLQLNVDDHGLKVHAELIDTQSNRDIFKSIKAGLLDKMSFAFVVSECLWEIADDNSQPDIRTITKIEKLFDVSVVDVPAYEQTEIYARNKDAVEKEHEEFKKLKLEKQKLMLLLDL